MVKISRAEIVLFIFQVHSLHIQTFFYDTNNRQQQIIHRGCIAGYAAAMGAEGYIGAYRN